MHDDAGAQAGRPKETWDPLAVLLLLGLIAIIFGTALRFGFVYDDRWTVLDNPVLRAPGNLRWLLGRGFVRAGVPDAARPVMLASEMLDWALWRTRPAGWHLQNLVWHAGVVLLLFAHLRRWGLATLLALGTSALFAVHPLVVEPVVAINYREDLLAAFFVLLALWFATLRGGPARNVAGAAALLLGGLAKENALVTPLLLLVVIAVAPAQPAPMAGSQGRWTRARPPLLALAAAALAALAWHWWALGGPAQVSLNAEIPIEHRDRLATIPRAALTFAQGVAQFFWPATLAPEYPDLPAHSLITAWGWAAVAAIAAVTAGALRARRQAPLVSLGWLIAVVAYLPNFGLVPLTNLRADRYFYLPALGLSIAVGSLLAALAQRSAPPPRRSAPPGRVAVGFGLLVLTLGWRSRRQERIWRDDVSLFGAAVAADPQSQRAWIGLGTAQLRQGQTMAALEAAQKALAVADAPRARELRGLVWLVQGDGPQARADLERALAGASGPHRAQVLNNLALAEMALHDRDSARAHWRQAIPIAPRFERPALQLAWLALDEGDLPAARADLIALLQRVPESSDGWRLLAEVETRAGRADRAAAAAAHARTLGGAAETPGAAPGAQTKTPPGP